MFTIIETLLRLVVLIICTSIEIVATVLKGVKYIFGVAGDALERLSSTILRKFGTGKNENKQEIAE